MFGGIVLVFVDGVLYLVVGLLILLGDVLGVVVGVLWGVMIIVVCVSKFFEVLVVKMLLY